jgi:Fe-S-cluster-containing hydrogenase component 2
MAIPTIDKEKCNGCEECVEACPAEAITLVDEKAVINADECTECSECVETCPEEAITEED